MNLSASLSGARQKLHIIVRAITCSILLVLPACHLPILQLAEPGPVVPGDYGGPTSSAPATTDPKNSAQLGVDEFYSDRMLTGLIHQALVGNQELKALNQEVRIAQNDILARQGAYLPFVTAGGSVSLDKPSDFTPLGAVEKRLGYRPGRFFPDPLADYKLGLNFFWTPDLFRALRNARDAAAQHFLATVERRNFFVTRLIAEVAENYYGLMALDQRLENLNKTITLQQRSLDIAKARLKAARGTELAVQRFQAEVRKNQSEKLIVNQEIVQVENRINFLANRPSTHVDRDSTGFFDLTIHALNVGVPAQLLQNRPDIREAEHELEAAGLDVKIARSRFFPAGNITGGVGYEAFTTKYLFTTPEALIYNIAGNLVAPLINKKAIKADYLSANARQLESIYNYQRLILNAFTEVLTRVSKVENYRKSIVLKKQQLEALEASVDVATKLFQNPRVGASVEYLEVLLALRDLLDARNGLIQTKREELSAIVNAYQALGGGITKPVPDDGSGGSW